MTSPMYSYMNVSLIVRDKEHSQAIAIQDNPSDRAEKTLNLRVHITACSNTEPFLLRLYDLDVSVLLSAKSVDSI